MHHRRLFAPRVAVLAVALLGIACLGVSLAASGGATTYATAGAAVVDGVSGGPWNTSQGDAGAGGAYPAADLFPYTPGGAGVTTLGGVTEPNLAVYPGAGSGGSPTAAPPYPSGVAGSPGPLDGYCSSLGANPETGSPVAQPAGVLPFAPYYFPDVIRNADGSLTGYFDYRPKDADEAITVARSTDGGVTWATEGEALDQNQGYCPTADTNDDGQGHPFVMRIGGASTDLYTLQRPAGDNAGVGLLVHGVDPTAADPLAADPASESVGVDPNTFATASAGLQPSGGVPAAIAVSTLGSAGSPDQIAAGPYEDLDAPNPWQSIITCTAAAGTSLSGCTVANPGGLTVNAGDDLVEVIATAAPKAPATSFTIPQGPNTQDAAGGLGTLNIANGNPVTSPVTTYLMNLNAPNRVYIDGATVYCAQSNANPTNKLENCTTTNPGGLVVNAGDAITADPITPPSARMTTGLLAPDGIVGTLPGYPGAPAGATVVLYTEKVLSYFIVGTTNAKITLPAATINYQPSVTASEPLPAPGTPFTVYLGTTTASPIQQISCSGWAAASSPAGSVNLTGCSGGSGTVASGNWVGGPNAAVVPFSVLNQIGEGNNGSSKGPEKLFGNNEDLTVLRAAYTTDGVDFTDLGAISGATSGTGNDTGSYGDVSNPLQQTSPSATSPSNLSPGSADTIELRYVGSRGTILTNPDGSLGMFLSGAWATDGDSDAFNQIFYTSSTDGGQTWSVPTVVLSTDYTFSASAAQDAALAAGTDSPLGAGAYYSGRAYGPAVVQNPDGTLTMVFSGYRLPKPIVNAGTVLGTGGHYTVGTTDPALYRNILTVTLDSSTSPPVATSSSLNSSNGSVTYGAQVTYGDSVSVPAPGTGTPTGSVDFFDGGAPIGGCQGVALVAGAAKCTTVPAAGARQVTAVYSGDSNYSPSTGAFDEQVGPATLTVQVTSQSRLFGQPNPAPAYAISGLVNSDPQSVVSGAAACSTTAVATSPGGSYPITCSLGTLAAANYTFAFVPGTLAVTYSRVLSGIVIGPLRVGAGQAVELGSGAFLLGSASVSAGGSLDVERAIVSGPLTATGAATLRLCAAGVVGPLSASGDSGPVLIGDGTSACGPSALGGPLTLAGDTGGVEIEKAAVTGAASVTGGAGGVTVTGNGVLGSLTVTGNGGGASVTGNTVLGSLTVTGNSGTVVDRPNSVFGRSILQ